jgi:hypothetical protein
MAVKTETQMEPELETKPVVEQEQETPTSSNFELKSASELASIICNKLVEAGNLKTTPTFLRKDREDRLAAVFESCGLDGAKMCSLGRTQDVRELEPLVRGATRGETWVEHVLTELEAILNDIFFAAGDQQQIQMQEEAQEIQMATADCDDMLSSVSDDCSTATLHSISTNAIPVGQTLHVQQRMYQRDVDLHDCQHTIKHGKVYESSARRALNRHDVRYGIVHPDKPLVLITDESLMTGITVIRFPSTQSQDEYVKNRLGAVLPTEEQRRAIKAAIEGAFDRRDEAERNSSSHAKSGSRLLPAATVHVPPCAIAHVIGKQGATILQLQNDTKTFAACRRHDSKWKPTPVDLYGADDAVAVAKAKIDAIVERELANEKARQELPVDWKTRPDFKYEQLCVPAHAVGLVIGKEGSRLEQFKREGAELKVIDTAGAIVHVRGLPDAVAAAIDKIEGMITSSSRDSLQRLSVSEEVWLPMSSVGHVIGGGGSMLKQLRSAGAELTIDERVDGSATAFVCGSPAEVANVVARIDTIVARSSTSTIHRGLPRKQRVQALTSTSAGYVRCIMPSSDDALELQTQQHGPNPPLQWQPKEESAWDSSDDEWSDETDARSPHSIAPAVPPPALDPFADEDETTHDEQVYRDPPKQQQRQDTPKNKKPRGKKKTVKKKVDPGGAMEGQLDKAERLEQSMNGRGDRGTRARQKEKYGTDRPEE